MSNSKKILDVFPQVLRCQIDHTAPNYTEIEVPTGLAALRALQFRANTRTAIELLKVNWTHEAGAALGRVFMLLVATKPRITEANLSDSGVIGKDIHETAFVTTGGYSFPNHHCLDFTSGGIGRLITSDNLYIGVILTGATGAKTYHAQVTFRYVTISLQEFSDLKESQVTYE